MTSASWRLHTERGSWLANVKGEIDLDDEEGSDHCVVNEQRIVADTADAEAAIRQMATLVISRPLDALQSMQMPGDDDDDDDGTPIGDTITRTTRVVLPADDSAAE